MIFKKNLLLLSIGLGLGFVQKANAEPASQSTLTIESAFEKSALPMQIVLLSSQEMKETQGAWAENLFAAGGSLFSNPALLATAGIVTQIQRRINLSKGYQRN